MRTIGNNFRTGTITAVSYDQGSSVYDVRLNEGAHYRGVPIAGLGSASLFPVEVGQTVHLIFPNGAYDLPYIVSADAVNVAESTASAGASDDYSPDSRDLVLRHAQNTLSLSESGVTIAPVSTARVQLASGESLRISEGGDADNQVLNADPFIDELYTYLAGIETTIRAIQAHLRVVNVQLSSAYPAITPTATASETPPPPSSASQVRARATKNASLLIP